MSISKITTKVLNTLSNESSNKPYLELKSCDEFFKSVEKYKITTNDLLEYLDLMNEYENIKLYFDFSDIDLSEIFSKLPNVRTLVLTSNNPIFTQPDFYYNDTIQIYPAKLETLVFSMKICKDKITSLSDYNDIALLPSTLKHLSLLDYTDPLPILPSSLKTLFLGDDFNQPVNNLPVSLEELHLGDYFNQPLDNLPPNLKKLYINSSFFNYPVDYLPYGLEILQFGYGYNKLLNNLPIKLKYLDIMFYSSQETETLNLLPDSIEHLVVDIPYVNIDKLPENLKILEYFANSNEDIDDLNKLNFLEEKYPNVQFRKIK